MRKTLVVLILVAPIPLACRQPSTQPARMNTSSSTATRTSTQEVAASLPAADAKRFRSALGLIAALDLWERNPSAFARALALGPTPLSPPSGDVLKRVHGLTAKEVIALADQLAGETQGIHGLTADDVIALAHKVAAEGNTKEEAARAAYDRAAQAQLAEEAVVRATEAAYFPRVEIRGLEVTHVPRIEVVGRSKAEKGSTPLGGAFAKVAGEVNNRGEKSVDKVELTITLLDGGGRRLAGKSHPVRLMRFDRAGEVAPLKSGEKRTFSLTINDLPSEWAGKVEARITAVKFTAPN